MDDVKNPEVVFPKNIIKKSLKWCLNKLLWEI